MADDDYEKGMKIRKSVLGQELVEKAEANKTDFDKDFQEYITKNAWGSIWSREGLSKRERSLITIALMTALGHDNELELHLEASKNTGATMMTLKKCCCTQPFTPAFLP